MKLIVKQYVHIYIFTILIYIFFSSFLTKAFLNVQQCKQEDQQVGSTKTTSTPVSMNVMGQLIDKAKRVIVMRTITNDKLQQEQQIQYQPSQINSTKPMLPIRIQELEAKIENRPTIVDEKSSAVLKYRTPHFRYEYRYLKSKSSFHRCH